MKFRFRAALLSTALICTSAFSGESESISQAKEAASSWLKLVDSGNYAASWAQASSLFKAAVTESSWESALKSSRGSLGAIRTREVQSAIFTRTMPGGPDGEYVVIKYVSHFEHKASAIETVTPMIEKDGSWHVSGYYVK
jgi:hypothetical protein